VVSVTDLSPRAVFLAGLSIAVCSSAALALDPPLVTDIDDFFVFNSKGVPPVPDDYHLVVDGAVDTPLVVDMNDVRQYPASTQMATLECAIPGGTTLLVGNAVWTGAPVRTLLETAGLPGDAASVRFHALDLYSLGDFDLAEIQSSDGIMLAYEMNGQELPPEQGAPLRLVVPGAGGFNWVQFVCRIEVKSTPPTAE
jgi:DMSO/TMAO reductase YedYZ molybdopterin-dependent catalytic subunit